MRAAINIETAALPSVCAMGRKRTGPGSVAGPLVLVSLTTATIVIGLSCPSRPIVT